jgi:hypothetical protein
MLTFRAFRLKTERQENQKQISHYDRFSEFHFATFVPRQLERKEINLRLGEFNANVLKNIKHDNWNLRKTINFTTALLVEKKRTKNTG